MENVIHSRRDRRQKDAFHPFESTIEVVSRDAVNGELRAIGPQGAHTGAVVEFAGHKLHNNGTGWYTFVPSAGKRFIEQSYKVLPDFLTGIQSKITILDSPGSFEVACTISPDRPFRSHYRQSRPTSSADLRKGTIGLPQTRDGSEFLCSGGA